MMMRTKTRLIAAALLLNFVFLVGAVGCPDSGKPADDFTLQPVEGGKAISLSQLKGKPTLVVFWATWCPPCKREIPVLKEIYVKYGKKLNMVGVAINYKQTQQEVANFSRANGLQYTILWDAENKAADNYCVSGIPTVVLVDPQGIVQYRGNQITDQLTGLLERYAGKST